MALGPQRPHSALTRRRSQQTANHYQGPHNRWGRTSLSQVCRAPLPPRTPGTSLHHHCQSPSPSDCSYVTLLWRRLQALQMAQAHYACHMYVPVYYRTCVHSTATSSKHTPTLQAQACLGMRDSATSVPCIFCAELFGVLDLFFLGLQITAQGLPGVPCSPQCLGLQGSVCRVQGARAQLDCSM